MGNKAVISKQQILETAYKLILDVGPANFSIRNVAKACGVSVGSLYNYYPTKAALVADAIGMFWKESLHEEMFIASSDEDFIAFCERLMVDLTHALAAFRRDWLSELTELDAESRKEVSRREEYAFKHIRAGLAIIIEHDRNLHLEALGEDVSAESLATLVWDAMASSLKRGDESYRALFALMRATLYGQK